MHKYHDFRCYSLTMTYFLYFHKVYVNLTFVTIILGYFAKMPPPAFCQNAPPQERKKKCKVEGSNPAHGKKFYLHGVKFHGSGMECGI